MAGGQDVSSHNVVLQDPTPILSAYSVPDPRCAAFGMTLLIRGVTIQRVLHTV